MGATQRAVRSWGAYGRGHGAIGASSVADIGTQCRSTGARVYRGGNYLCHPGGQDPQPVVNAFGEPLCAVSDNVSVTQASPFLRATVPRFPKIGLLRQVHPCGGLVIDFPGEDPVLSDDDDDEE
uniref:Uncharacterized protein n=1 Tax=Romanomermis culicivorax TaxID=13658 RepID=A0A915K781_ROMCU